MKKITLQTLKCYETEDFTGRDSCRLEVLVDGVLQSQLKKNLNEKDEPWSLNQFYFFNKQVMIKLWDEDNLDPDDLLGVVTINSTNKDNATASFTLDGANYKLWYNVVDAPNVNPVEEALNKFANSTKKGVFPHIDKVSLIKDVRATLDNKFLVNQADAGWCGPAVIVFELVSRNPLRYIQICQQLYETGKFNGRTQTFQPSPTFINSKIGKNLSQADWMLLGAMRDEENGLFAINKDSPAVADLTTPTEMQRWIKEILSFQNVDYESTYFWGEENALKKARDVVNKGGVAFLLVDSGVIQPKSPNINYPDHWVSLLGNVSITSDNFKFNIYTWGKVLTFNKNEEAFEDFMWGVVTAY